VISSGDDELGIVPKKPFTHVLRKQAAQI